MTHVCTKPHLVREAAAPAIPVLPAILEATARHIFDSFSEKMKQTLNGRQERALKLALEGHVIHKAARVFHVRSEDGQHTYLVNLERNYCTCPDSQGGHVCKHRLAAYLVEQAQQARQETSPCTDTPPELPASSSPAPLHPDEEAIERARLALNARSEFLREAIIYAVLVLDGEPLQVELVELDGEAALVRALPKIKDGRLLPQFPFPERKPFARVLARSLTQIAIYR